MNLPHEPVADDRQGQRCFEEPILPLRPSCLSVSHLSVGRNSSTELEIEIAETLTVDTRIFPAVTIITDVP